VTDTRPTWAALFDRASSLDVDETAVQDTVAAANDADGDTAPDSPRDPDPTRVVAAPAVLVADLFVDGPARAALDLLRAHSWTALVASTPLLDAAERAIARSSDDADPALAADWRARVEAWREPVVVPTGDDPALASAYRGGAMHVLTRDERVTSAAGGTALRARVETSAREPAAFARLFDPESLYEHAVGETYDGPDRDPRA
jgi:hypothetical protein